MINVTFFSFKILKLIKVLVTGISMNIYVSNKKDTNIKGITIHVILSSNMRII